MKEHASKATIEAGMRGWVRGASDRKSCERCGAPGDYIIKSGERKGLLHSYCLTCRNAMVLASARRGKEAKEMNVTWGGSDGRPCTKCPRARDYRYRSGKRKGLPHPLCKRCRALQQWNWVQRNKDKERARALAYLAANTSRKLRWELKCYGKDEVWYAQQLKRQGGVCAICKKPETRRAYRGNGSVARLGLDHHHGTGRVRGLLCSKCNWKLGILEDGPWVRAAMRYLKMHERDGL